MNSFMSKKPTHTTWEEYIVVPIFNDKKKPNPKGTSGLYEVTLSLAYAGNALATNNIGPIADKDGKTQIRMRYPNADPKTAISKVKITTESFNIPLTYWLRLNEEGYWGNILFEKFTANNFRDAFNISYKAVSLFLSSMSFKYDTSIVIKNTELKELKTGSVRFIALAEEIEKPVTLVDLIKCSDNQAKLLGLYREAVNSVASPQYMLLCFYKIIEGVYHLRGLRGKNNIVLDDETLPTDTNYEYSGKKFTYVRDQVRKLFRTSFAHFSTKREDLIERSPDDPNDWYDVLRILPEVRYITRKLLQTELNIF